MMVFRKKSIGKHYEALEGFSLTVKNVNDIGIFMVLLSIQTVR